VCGWDRERNHGTWNSSNTKLLMNWTENPSAPNNHRIRNHNTWKSNNNINIDPILHQNEGNNYYSKVNSSGFKKSSLVKPTYTNINTSICDISQNDLIMRHQINDQNLPI